MIEEDIAGSTSPLRIYTVATGLLSACPIPASQALELAILIVGVYRQWEKLHEAD